MTDMRFAPLALLAAGSFAAPAGAATVYNVNFDPLAGGETSIDISLGGVESPQFTYSSFSDTSAKLYPNGTSSLGSFVDPYRLPNGTDTFGGGKTTIVADGGDRYLLLAFDIDGVHQAGTATFSNTLLTDITYDLAPTTVPEPAVWAELIAGFGLAGSALRVGRRRRTVAA